MRITHYITIDKGSGPVSLVEIRRDDGATVMLRITHNARYDRTKEVDPIATRAAVDSSPDLGQVNVGVDPSLSGGLTSEVLRWAVGQPGRLAALRWGPGGEAVQFATEADAVAWDHGNQTTEAPPRRRRMILG